MPTAFAQNLDNAGNEFLCAFMPNAVTDLLEIELHLTSDVPTMVTVNYPMGAPTFTSTVAVNPGAITIVTVPPGAASDWLPNNIQDNLVQATAAEEFTCYLIHRRPFTSDAALGLPTDTMNTEFIVADRDPTLGDEFGYFSEFIVYARFDNTTVTITPTADLAGGRTAGVPFQVMLDAGEGYFGYSINDGPAGSVTGTLIDSDRVVGVSNGSQCLNVPDGTGFCDHIFEVAQPTQTWGNDYLVANLPNRPNGSYYRVIGATANTDILLDGAPLGTIGRGEFIDIADLMGNHRFTSMGGEAFFVVQFMTGSQSPGAISGDPSMGNVISVNQYKNAYTFSTVGGAQFIEHWLTLIAADSDIGAVTLDGAAVPAASFTSIAGTGYSVALLPISEGTHSTASPNGHAITVEGFNQDDSYLYPGGALFEFINPVGDANAPLCTGDQYGDRYEGTGTDDRPSEDTNNNGVLDPGEDLNNNGQIDEDTGVFFVQLAGGAVNLDLMVAPFQPGDGSVDFTVTPTDSTLNAMGTVLIVDGAGNQTGCPVQFIGSIGDGVCDAVANSTGERAFTSASGSLMVADNNLTLTTNNLPTQSMGFYIVSQGNGIVSMPGNKLGNLCIVDTIMGRHNATPLDTGAGTSVSLNVDLQNLPQPFNGPAMVTAGSTWYWQYWYRDNAVFQGAANFCNGIGLSFQ